MSAGGTGAGVAEKQICRNAEAMVYAWTRLKDYGPGPSSGLYMLVTLIMKELPYENGFDEISEAVRSYFGFYDKSTWHAWHKDRDAILDWLERQKQLAEEKQAQCEQLNLGFVSTLRHEVRMLLEMLEDDDCGVDTQAVTRQLRSFSILTDQALGK